MEKEKIKMSKVPYKRTTATIGEILYRKAKYGSDKDKTIFELFTNKGVSN